MPRMPWDEAGDKMNEILPFCRFCESPELDLINQRTDTVFSGVDAFMTALQTKQDLGELLDKQTFGFIYCLKCGRINQKITEGDVKHYRESIKEKT